MTNILGFYCTNSSRGVLWVDTN